MATASASSTHASASHSASAGARSVAGAAGSAASVATTTSDLQKVIDSAIAACIVASESQKDDAFFDLWKKIWNARKPDTTHICLSLPSSLEVDLAAHIERAGKLHPLELRDKVACAYRTVFAAPTAGYSLTSSAFSPTAAGIASAILKTEHRPLNFIFYDSLKLN